VAKLFAIAALAILLFTAGAVFLVYRLTDYPVPSRTAAERAAAAAPPPAPYDPPVYAQPPADYSSQEPGSAVVIPARPPPTGAVQNEAAPIQGPTAVPLPEDGEARGAAISNIRNQRVNDQMDRINQRNRARLGLRPQDPAPEPPKE
jgi:hypothetical protein